MEVRSEKAGDEQAISTVITAAFAEAEHSGGNEARVVKALRAAKGLAVSLVATDNGRIVGHVAFSPVTIDDRPCGWFGLGPVAVIPDRQGRGVGTALINAGLAALRDAEADGCVVLGDPAYYGRFGFKSDRNLRLEGIPPGYFQRLSLVDRACGGIVRYHSAFEAA